MVHEKKSADVRKIWWAPVLVLAAALALAGCEDKITQVEGTVSLASDKASGPANVTAAKTTDNAYAIVKWDAADGGTQYNVFAHQEGKKTVDQGWQGQNAVVYAAADGTTSANADVDKWSTLITVSALQAGKKYRFGVQARNLDYILSDIVWTDYIQF